jgi:hypothetical protein
LAAFMKQGGAVLLVAALGMNVHVLVEKDEQST